MGDPGRHGPPFPENAFALKFLENVESGKSWNFQLSSGKVKFHGYHDNAKTPIFNKLISNPKILLFWHTIFMFLTIYVVSKGAAQ